jgi:hypothetical protein
MLVAYATMEAGGIPIALIQGHEHEGGIGDEQYLKPTQWILLGIAIGSFVLAAGLGWVVSRLPQSRIRSVAATIAAVTAIIAGVIDAGPARLVDTAIVVGGLLILTGCGVGSVVGWAMRMMLSHLATVGALAIRALPVMLLTALVFFNTYVWILAATIDGVRLSLALAFLLAIAVAFVVSATVERVRPNLQTAALPTDSDRLTDTPFTSIPDAPSNPPLTRGERLNVMLVMVTSQVVQILVLAAITATIYLILGLIVLTPALLNEWTHTSVSITKILGVAIPAPDSLIHMCLLLAAMTFMYISARAVGDGNYRSTFLDPLLDDLRNTLVARNSYRAVIAASSTVEIRRRKPLNEPGIGPNGDPDVRRRRS